MPSATSTCVPGRASSAACPIDRSGAASVPGFASSPSGDTKIEFVGWVGAMDASRGVAGSVGIVLAVQAAWVARMTAVSSASPGCRPFMGLHFDEEITAGDGSHQPTTIGMCLW